MLAYGHVCGGLSCLLIDVRGSGSVWVVSEKRREGAGKAREINQHCSMVSVSGPGSWFPWWPPSVVDWNLSSERKSFLSKLADSVLGKERLD